MQKLVQLFKDSEFLRHNAVFFAGSMAVSVLNYLYYPVLGHLLKPAAFGEVQTLISLFLQIAIFLTVLGLLTVNLVANYGDKPEVQRTILELEKLALFISAVGLIIAVACGPILQRFFRFDEVMPFIVLAIAVVVSVPSTFRMAYLRGKQKFGLNSWAQLIGAGSKLVFSVILIALGFGTTGAIAGLVIAQIVSFVYAGVKAEQAGFKLKLRTNFWRMPDMKLILPELKYAGLVLVGSLVITALYSIDIIAVKHYFDSRTAGLYAGIATVARIIFFLTGSISQVLLPAVKLTNSDHDNRQVLKKSAILLVAIGGVALLVFWLLPGLIMQILLGHEYRAYAHLLPLLSLVVFIVSVINLIVLYHMALRRYAIAYIAIIGLAVTCGLVVISHASLQAVINSMLYGTLTMAGLLAGWTLATTKKKEGNDG
jgi:O-antigen/teichoic acid export membrane protein